MSEGDPGGSTKRRERKAPPCIEVDNVHVSVPSYEPEARRLRKHLRLYFYAAFKWKGKTCSFHIIYCFVFAMQIVKVSLLTAQMIDFGHDRANFSSVVNRGHITLRHLLLKDWDASWETLPYPPAHGDFAVYTISDWESAINFAVQRYHSAERDAIGYYKMLPDNRMVAIIKYFDFLGFDDSDTESSNKIHIYDKTISLERGWHKNDTYNITTEFVHYNITQPFKRMLSVTLHFTINSVRSRVENGLATCLRIEGWVEFSDLDNNGQVNVQLRTATRKIKCAKMNLNLEDWTVEDKSKTLGGTLLAFCFISLLLTILTLAFALYVYCRTKQFMRKYFREYFGVENAEESDLPTSEYFRFIKLWDLVTIISDSLTIYATVWIVFNKEEDDWMLATLDSYATWLGVAGVMAWLSLLRFFKFHNKFHLLFNTLYRAFWDVMAYLACVTILFVGFWICGFVVMGPYHVKFQTPATSAETLFSIINGDEIYATLAILETSKSGGDWVKWFSRFYLGCFVAVFTIVVINLLIALFMNAYEAIRAMYEEKPEDRELAPVEKALKHLLLQSTLNSSFRRSVSELLSADASSQSKEELALKCALGSIVRVSKTANDVMFLKPRTLKTFMEDGESGRKTVDCGTFCTCSIATFSEGN